MSAMETLIGAVIKALKLPPDYIQDKLKAVDEIRQTALDFKAQQDAMASDLAAIKIHLGIIPATEK